MNNRIRLCGIVAIIGAALICATASAETPAVAVAEKTDAVQFVGAWKKEKDANSFVLIYMGSDGRLNVRGQDLASAWGAKCTRGIPGQFVCDGIGEMLASGKAFLFSSTMKIRNGRIEEQWRADGRKDGKLDTASGVDLFEKH